ncbi:2-C-methyl-D-erythritol 4-phosphate cytidylyltransferase [Ureaplasma diversum]|uniref:4-diphosphocytidyl-2C-methyl-D-erythritolsynthase n=1 Tax=Ureaplasma diversum NCTC 246 TaxID=1188241 RepID=A0A084EWX0_9BACT|nr:2-C-methyl-D-erythritol 4-phosphate cytidylyltransferase [Ureaplasma diversum]KEZ22462.1 4-diphosphocytidyl-2C-methyl-D-erythritolsynthase [Ureaplasma diversum NCTC 246]
MNKNEKELKYTAVILAGGVSKRFGRDKLFEKINGISVIDHSVYHFNNDPLCERIFLLVRATSFDHFRKHFRFDNKIVCVKAESTRIKSAQEAVKLVKSKYVFFHDASRPFLSNELLNNLKDELVFLANGVVPAVNVNQSLIKIVNKVRQYVDSDNYYFSQTPEAYVTDKIKVAFESNPKIKLNTEIYEIYEQKFDDLQIINGDVSNKTIIFESDL